MRAERKQLSPSPASWSVALAPSAHSAAVSSVATSTLAGPPWTSQTRRMSRVLISRLGRLARKALSRRRSKSMTITSGEYFCSVRARRRGPAP